MSVLERTFGDLARPRWEGSPTFGSVWQSFCAVAGAEQFEGHTREWACDQLRWLTDARVLVVDSTQVEVLPSIPTALLSSVAANISTPFETVYLDLGLAEIAGRRIAGVLFRADVKVAWALERRRDSSLTVPCVFMVGDNESDSWLYKGPADRPLIPKTRHLVAA